MAVGDPINWNDIQTIRDYTVGMPLVRLIQGVAQSIPSGTATALTFTTEDIDTHGFHDNSTNPSRVTPSVAGYYRITGTYWTASTASTTNTSLEVWVRKNGTDIPAAGRDTGPSGVAITGTRGVISTVIQTANGTSDYFEVIASQASGGAVNTNVGTRQSSTFEVEFLRPL